MGNESSRERKDTGTIGREPLPQSGCVVRLASKLSVVPNQRAVQQSQAMNASGGSVNIPLSEADFASIPPVGMTTRFFGPPPSVGLQARSILVPPAAVPRALCPAIRKELSNSTVDKEAKRHKTNQMKTVELLTADCSAPALTHILSSALREGYISGNLELGIETMRSLTNTIAVRSQDTVLTELSSIARSRETFTRLSLSVDAVLADLCSPTANILCRELPRVTTLEICFVGQAVHLNTGIRFVRRCLEGVSHLTSLSLCLETAGLFGAASFDWSVLSHLEFLRIFSLTCCDESLLNRWSCSLVPMASALSRLKLLEKVTVNEVTLCGTGTPVASITDFLRGRSLVTLHLKDVFLSGGAVNSFASGFVRSTLKDLWLYFHCRALNDYDTIMMAIASCSEMRKLTLTWGSAHWVAAPLKTGAMILRQNSRLHHLCLRSFEIPDDQAEEMYSMLVHPRCVLEWLEIRDCQFSFAGMGMLLASVTPHTTLRHLYLSRPKCTTALSEYLVVHAEFVTAKVVTLVNGPLKSLVLGGQFAPCFNREQAQGILRCLARSYSLETMEIQGMIEKDRLVMDSIGRLNAAGRGYMLTSMSRKTGVEVLCKVSVNLDDVFTHLRENPSLCIY